MKSFILVQWKASMHACSTGLPGGHDEQLVMAIVGEACIVCIAYNVTCLLCLLNIM